MGLRMFGRDPPRLGKRKKKTGKTFLFFFFVVWHLKNEIIISRRLALHGCTRSMGQVRLHLPSDSGRQTNSPPPPPLLLLLLILFVPFIPMTYIERREVRGCWVNFCPSEWGTLPTRFRVSNALYRTRINTYRREICLSVTESQRGRKKKNDSKKPPPKKFLVFLTLFYWIFLRRNTYLYR